MTDGCGTVPIKVFCRFRPLNAAECHTEFIPALYDNGISLSLSGKPYTFDKVFGPESNQTEVYRDGVSAIVQDVLSGYNGTVFAYGQTSSGKTHTMEGSPYGGRDDDESGITPRVVLDVFRHIKKLPPHIQASLKVSYFEVYMEKVRDLLDVTKVNLPVHEDKNRVPYVKGVTEVDVCSMDEVFDIIDEGQSNRSVAVTNMNEHSSRSHSVFVLQVKQSDVQSEKTLHGKLYLVDLAGSEKVNKTGSEGITLKEAAKINKSLSALGNVILALADGNKNHVPYRDSKLTRILQQSLGGNSRTSIFICCSPSSSNESETKSSLMFGQRAKTIKNEIKVNEELTAEEWKRRFEKEKENNMKLRTKLAQYELGTLPKANSPDVIPQSSSSTSCPLPAAAVVPTLTSHSSLPCLLPQSIPELSEACHECLKYQQDISKLYQQLDDRDDELGERSREILDLESKVRDNNETIETLAQNNALLLSNYRDIENSHTEAKSEVKEVLAALEELADSYNSTQTDAAERLQEIYEKNRMISYLEEDLQRTKEELGKVKVEYKLYQRRIEEETSDVRRRLLQLKSAEKLHQTIDAIKKKTW